MDGATPDGSRVGSDVRVAAAKIDEVRVGGVDRDGKIVVALAMAELVDGQDVRQAADLLPGRLDRVEPIQAVRDTCGFHCNEGIDEVRVDGLNAERDSTGIRGGKSFAGWQPAFPAIVGVENAGVGSALPPLGTDESGRAAAGSNDDARENAGPQLLPFECAGGLGHPAVKTSTFRFCVITVSSSCVIGEERHHCSMSPQIRPTATSPCSCQAVAIAASSARSRSSALMRSSSAARCRASVSRTYAHGASR